MHSKAQCPLEDPVCGEALFLLPLSTSGPETGVGITPGPCSLLDTSGNDTYIDQNVDKPVSVDELAGMVYMGRTSVYETFRDAMHLSLLQYAKSV
jgi:hypothetical protein